MTTYVLPLHGPVLTNDKLCLVVNNTGNVQAIEPWCFEKSQFKISAVSPRANELMGDNWLRQCRHVTWVFTVHWGHMPAKLGIGILLVINTTGSLTFNTPTMAFLLYTSSQTIEWLTWLSSPHSYQNGLNVSFSVNFKSGRTADSAKQGLDENPALHKGAEFIIVARGGWMIYVQGPRRLGVGGWGVDDLCPGPEEVANRLWDVYTKLSKNANRVDVCTLIPRPKYDQFHQYMIDTTNSKIRQLFGGKERRDVL